MVRTKTRTYGLLVAMLAGTLIAGCGGGESPSDVPASEPAAAASPIAEAPIAEAPPVSGGPDAAPEPTPEEQTALDVAAATAAPAEKQIVVAPADRRVPGQYIVTLREDAGATGKSIDDKADRSLKRAGGG
ncbi:MAG: hypothetical protein EHM87_19200, partial [Burkholderiales bacterium]